MESMRRRLIATDEEKREIHSLCGQYVPYTRADMERLEGVISSQLRQIPHSICVGEVVHYYLERYPSLVDT